MRNVQLSTIFQMPQKPIKNNLKPTEIYHAQYIHQKKFSKVLIPK